MSDLTELLLLIKIHHEKHQDHGLDCACMDKHIARFRQMTKVDSAIDKCQRRVDYVLRMGLEHR